MSETFNILIVAQSGRLTYEAVLFAASLAHSAPQFQGNLYVAEPEDGPLWSNSPGMSDEAARACLKRLGANIVSFQSRHFGEAYPNGNKIEALRALPANEPFVFFDTDTMITGPLDQVRFDFERPSASMKREGTWPQIELYGPGYTQIWRTLYDRFDLEFEPTLDLDQPDEHWERYLYFNAGWFYYRCPQVFADTMEAMMLSIRDDTPDELVCQKLYPWLDQIALPLAIHKLGGGRPGLELSGLDGDVSCHWRYLPLLYAREPDATVTMLEEVTAPNWIKKVLKSHEPFLRMIYQGKGQKARALFDRDALPRQERVFRNKLKRANLWMR